MGIAPDVPTPPRWQGILTKDQASPLTDPADQSAGYPPGETHRSHRLPSPPAAPGFPNYLVNCFGEAAFRSGGVGRVIRHRRVDVCDLLLHHPLAGPELPDLLQQFHEVALIKPTVELEAFLVDGKPLQDVILQAVRGPSAELGGAGLLTR